MSEVTTANWSLEQDIVGYRRAGWPGIGVWLNKLSRSKDRYDVLQANPFNLSMVDEARRSIDEAGLRVSTVIATGDFTHDSDEERRRHVDHTRFSIEVSHRLGADALCICPGPLRGLTYRQAQSFTIQSLREVLAVAEEKQIRLAIEPLRSWHTDFVNTIDQTMELVEAINHPLIGVYLDTYQLWGTDLFAGIKRAGGHIAAVHLADSRHAPLSREDRLVPGDGVIPIGEIVRAIERTGYIGWYEIEIMSTELWQSDYDTLLRRCAHALQEVLP